MSIDKDDSQPRGASDAAPAPRSAYGDFVEVNPSVVLIAPDFGHLNILRRALQSQRATILREFNLYPSYAHLPALLESESDAFLVEIDSDLEIALELVETICNRRPNATVIVYAGRPDSDRMVRSMRAGAREFLSGNFAPTALQEALVRAAARRSEQSAKRATGKLFVFWGAKGGCGVTTLATNFAIALKAETSSEVALLDLNPHLGDVAVLLGITPKFTVAEALENGKRLDQEFVSTLVSEHSSGVSVLAAPDTYQSSVSAESRTVGKLVDVVRNQYPYVVVDAGRALGEAAEPLFQMATSIYLVTQLDIPSLRNTQRFLAYLRRDGERHVDVLVNRHEGRRTEFDEERVSKVLGTHPKWRVPNDYSAVYRSSNAGSPLIHEKSPAAAAIRTMARVAAGKPAAAEAGKRTWKIFG